MSKIFPEQVKKNNPQFEYQPITDPYEEQQINRTYNFPASYKEALIHQRATKFGYTSSKMSDGKPTPVCPCCSNLVNTIEIPICYETVPQKIVQNQRQFMLNTGTSLYFTFIKMSISYLFLRFIICDAFNVWTSLSGHYCTDPQTKNECSGDYNSYISGYNKHNSQDMWSIEIIDYLNIAVTIASIFLFFYCRKQLYKINDILERTQISQDEFSLYMSGFPLFIFDQDTKKNQMTYDYEDKILAKIQHVMQIWIDKVAAYSSETKKTFTKTFWQKIRKLSISLSLQVSLYAMTLIKLKVQIVQEPN